MSLDYEMDYFPPNGTKYKWESPPLRYRAIGCSVECLAWPQSLILTCDREESGYRGYLRFYSISDSGKQTKCDKTELYKTALEACLAIECMGDALLEEDIKPWMKEAIQNKWRTPYYD